MESIVSFYCTQIVLRHIRLAHAELAHKCPVQLLAGHLSFVLDGAQWGGSCRPLARHSTFSRLVETRFSVRQPPPRPFARVLYDLSSRARQKIETTDVPVGFTAAIPITNVYLGSTHTSGDLNQEALTHPVQPLSSIFITMQSGQ